MVEEWFPVQRDSLHDALANGRRTNGNGDDVHLQQEHPGIKNKEVR